MSVITSSTTRQLQKNAVAEWSKVLPIQATETYTGSVNFMKQLTVVAVSTITYMRNMFSEENYTTETFGGVILKILKNSCKDEVAQFVSTSLLQASDAFEKKYLHQLAICFYAGDSCPENLVEYHTFEYSYCGDNASINVSTSRGNVFNSKKCTFQNVREQTLRLLRAYTISLPNISTELPDSFDISLRLYYNDDAPPGYQAPGFLSPLEPRDHLAELTGACIKFGAVETNYHKLVTKMYCKDINESSDANANEYTPTSAEKEMDFEESVSQGGAKRTVTMRCPCNKNVVDDTCDILICKYCGKGGHSVCYGLRRQRAGAGERARGDHCCDRCADADTRRRPPDDKLHRVPFDKRECLCIMRRALWMCRERGEVSAASLAARFQLSQLNACKLMKLLRQQGIVLSGDDDDLTTPRKVIRDQLERAMNENFQREEDDIVERLHAETLSPEEHVDPVGDVLKPMEKITLRNATTLGQIIEPTPPKLNENPTLQQYREAILSNEQIEEELPLSGNHNPVKDMEKIGKITTKRKIEGDKKPRTAVKTKKVKLASK